MPRRFADAETISATGAFLVGELERSIPESMNRSQILRMAAISTCATM